MKTTSKLKAMALKMGTAVSSLALMLGVSSLDAVCVVWLHQPKVPQGMEKFKAV